MQKNIFFYISIFAGLMYAGIGIFLIVSKQQQFMPRQGAIVLGSVFILYAAFRLYRTYLKSKRNDPDDTPY